MKKILISLAFSLFCIGVIAQTRTITGVVIGNGNDPLPGATVVQTGSSNGTVTSLDGTFSLSVSQDAASISVLYLGYDDNIVKLDKRSNYTIVMEENSTYLNDVVVIGYGTVRKSDLTGSVGSIRSEDLVKTNPISLEKGLQGRLTGVNVVQNDGAPGSGISVQIRGTNSFLGGTEPLYVVDGIPITTNNDQESINFDSDTYSYKNALSFLDPNDIESIEVLKDASSTAIYGSRGANGVILITTKSGKGAGSRDVVSFNYSLSVSNPAHKIRMLGASDYATYRNESAINTAIYNGNSITQSGLPFPGIDVEMSGHINGPEDYDNDPYYWQNQIFQTALTHTVSLNISGSDKNSDYSISGGYVNQEGTVIHSDFKRYSLKIDFNKQVKPWLKIGTSTNVSRSKSNMLKTTISSSSNGTEGVIRSALMYPPVYTVDSETAQDNEFGTVTTPNLYTTALNQQTNLNIYTSNYANIQLTKWLIFRSVLGYNTSINTANQYWPTYLWEGRNIGGKSYAGDKTWSSIVFDNILMMNQTFGKHNVSATLGTSWEESHWYNKQIKVQGFGTDTTNGWLLQGAGTINTPTSSKGDSQLFSVIMRAAYNYDSRYYLTFTAREDMSSKFAKENRAAFFPSVGVSWRPSQEAFWQDIKPVIDNMKIHYSYGLSGNQAISSYQTFALMSSANYPFGDKMVNGYAPDTYNPGNKDLKWETTYQHDLGIEMNLFKKIDVTVDWYHKRTEDLLQYKEVAPSYGIERILSNAGTVTNKGLELMIDAKIVEKKDFYLNIGGNISFNQNELSDFNSSPMFPNELWNSLRPFALMDGHSIGSLYGFVEDGIWSSREEIINSDQFQAQYPGYKVSDYDATTETILTRKWLGEIRYKNFDDDPNITDNDQQFIGNVNPDFIYGIHADMKVKGFDISVLFQGVHGNDIFNMGSLRFYDVGNSKNIPEYVYAESWTPETGGTAPKNFYDNGRTTRFSRRYVEDGSYLKLRNLQFGYTFNEKTIKNISSMRVYVSGNNLLTFTDYRGYDPEVNSFGSDPSLRGVDSGGYPQSRSFIFGVNVTF